MILKIACYFITLVVFSFQCNIQAGYGIFSEDHSWKMIKLKKSEDIFLSQHTI